MIVDFSNDPCECHIKTLSGKNYERTLVYSSLQNDTKCSVRPYVYPRITCHNKYCGARMQKAAILYNELPEAFKESLVIYARYYNRQHLPAKKLPLCGYNVFLKAVCKHKVRLYDLFSMSSIVGLFGSTIGDWISHGLLEKVKGRLSEAEVMVEGEIERVVDILGMQYLMRMCAVMCSRNAWHGTEGFEDGLGVVVQGMLSEGEEGNVEGKEVLLFY